VSPRRTLFDREIITLLEKIYSDIGSRLEIEQNSVGVLVLCGKPALYRERLSEHRTLGQCIQTISSSPAEEAV
jgi:hypothetical protein